MKQQHILLVLEHFWPHIGGAETMFEGLTKGLVKEGFDVTVVTSRLSGYKKTEELDGVKIYRTCKNRYLFTLFSIFTVWKYARQADVIQTTTFNAAFPAWFVGKLLGKPVVLIVLEVWGRDFWKKVPGFTFFHSLFERFIMSLSFDRYVAISESTKKHMMELYKIPGEKTEVIYPGVADDFYNTKSSGKKLVEGKYNFLYFGRPGWAKGLEILLRAFAKLKNDGCVLNLLLSRTPRSRYEYIMKLIKDLGITGRINQIKSVSRDDLKEIILANDCVVVPSLREGFGFSAVEACALGVPVLCSNVDSLPEVVFGRVKFFEAGNEDSLTTALGEVIEDRFEEIPKKVYSSEDCIEHYKNIYRGL